MSLVTGCAYNNPAGAVLPAQPAAAAAPNLAPNQGDHVFGDVAGTIGNAFGHVFGGGALVPTRINNYNSVLASTWQGFAAANFGHAGNPPVVNRQGAPEPDEHAHMHGGYSQRLQWQICEIVCAGHANGAEVRMIAGLKSTWRNAVLASLDEYFNHFVDETALQFYLASPNAIRQANPAGVRHRAISLAAAHLYVTNNNGPGKASLQTVITNLQTVPGQLRGMLDRFSGSLKTLNPVNNTWA